MNYGISFKLELPTKKKKFNICSSGKNFSEHIFNVYELKMNNQSDYLSPFKSGLLSVYLKIKKKKVNFSTDISLTRPFFSFEEKRPIHFAHHQWNYYNKLFLFEISVNMYLKSSPDPAGSCEDILLPWNLMNI